LYYLAASVDACLVSCYLETYLSGRRNAKTRGSRWWAFKTRLEAGDVRIDYGMAVDRVFHGATFCRCEKEYRCSLGTGDLLLGCRRTYCEWETNYWVSTHLRDIEGGEEA